MKKISLRAKFMLYWIGDPEEVRKQLEESGFPSIIVRNGEILRAGTREKLEFQTKKMERDAKRGISELEAKGLIERDRYGDMKLTDSGMSELGFARGYFSTGSPEKVHVLTESWKKKEEDRERIRERLKKERRAWQEK